MLISDNQTFFVDDNGDNSGVIGVYGETVEQPTNVYVVNQPTQDAPTVMQPTVQTAVAPTDQVQTTGTTTPTTTATPSVTVSDSKVGNKMLLVAIVMVVVVGVALFLTFKNAK